MKVLVVCEFSGIVRDAFRALGHDAWSLDSHPCERDSTYHIQQRLYPMNRVQEGMLAEYDLLICHPPCTYLASSGARWWFKRKAEQFDALYFVQWLMGLPVPRIALENPRGIIGTAIRPPDQTIQPYQFGHPEWKTTCLWLKNLPLLKPTNPVEPDMTVGGGKKPGRISSRLHRLGPSMTRQRDRSRTFQGIAEAMAEQWGNLPPNAPSNATPQATHAAREQAADKRPETK